MAATTKAGLEARLGKLQNSRNRDKAKRAALQRKLAEALEQQAATSEILRVIRSSPTDVQPVFEAIARNALALCRSSFANVFRYDGKLMHYAASHLVSPEQVTIVKQGYPAPPSRGRVAGRAILSKTVVCIEDALADPDYDHPVAAAAGWRRMFAVPMLRDGEPLGAIAVGWTEPGPVSATQQELLKTFAEQAVIAIENVRLFNETREALERQTATAEILKVISSSPTDVQPVFDAIVRSSMKLIGGYSAVVTRLIDDTLHLGALTTTSESGDAVLRSWFQMSSGKERGLFGKVIRSRAMVCSVDTETEPETDASGLRELARARGFRSVVAVPLLREGEAGVAMALDEHPDLILMDIQLPKISGLEAIRRLRAEPVTAATPIIALTSFALSGDDDKAKEAGATAYLAKPFSPFDLLNLICKLLPEG